MTKDKLKDKVKGICIIPKDQKSMKKFVDKTGKLVEEYLDVFDYGYKEGVKKTRQEFQEKIREIFEDLKCGEVNDCEDYEDAWDTLVSHIEKVKSKYGGKA